MRLRCPRTHPTGYVFLQKGFPQAPESPNAPRGCRIPLGDHFQARRHRQEHPEIQNSSRGHSQRGERSPRALSHLILVCHEKIYDLHCGIAPYRGKLRKYLKAPKGPKGPRGPEGVLGSLGSMAYLWAHSMDPSRTTFLMVTFSCCTSFYGCVVVYSLNVVAISYCCFFAAFRVFFCCVIQASAKNAGHDENLETQTWHGGMAHGSLERHATMTSLWYV